MTPLLKKLPAISFVRPAASRPPNSLLPRGRHQHLGLYAVSRGARRVSFLGPAPSSPDGTGRIADELAAADERIYVLHGRGKAGLGTAYLAGFEAALDQGYDTIVEMDADGSHQPEELPKLLTALAGADIVLGSRWVPGGKALNWPKSRVILSRAGNTYARIMLGILLCDTTGGYRAYRASALRKSRLENIESVGYCFQIDMARRAIQAGLTAAEVPITFFEPTHGASKMNKAIVCEALWRVTQWGIMWRLHRYRGRCRLFTRSAERSKFPSGPDSHDNREPTAERSGPWLCVLGLPA